ncbi:MAG: hypothetical protein K2X81_13220 [Candidatus Obscuribacterales bacterium]|nr:hypothetical protein [Candidatus Obscuribacterales bacterium]
MNNEKANDKTLTTEEISINDWPEPIHFSQSWMQTKGPDSAQFCVLFPVKGLHDLCCQACFIVNNTCDFDTNNLEGMQEQFQGIVEELQTKLGEILATVYSAPLQLSSLSLTIAAKAGKPSFQIELRDSKLIWTLQQQARMHESMEEHLLCDHLQEAVSKIARSCK